MNRDQISGDLSTPSGFDHGSPSQIFNESPVMVNHQPASIAFKLCEGIKTKPIIDKTPAAKTVVIPPKLEA